MIFSECDEFGEASAIFGERQPSFSEPTFSEAQMSFSGEKMIFSARRGRVMCFQAMHSIRPHILTMRRRRGVIAILCRSMEVGMRGGCTGWIQVRTHTFQIRIRIGI
jgi:hypothetical protein